MTAVASRVEEEWDGAWNAFLSANRACVQGRDRVSVLFSGGLDSSLVVWALHGKVDLQLVAVGVRGARDLDDAREGARLLGEAIDIVELSPADALARRQEWGAWVEGAPRSLEAVRLGMALAVASARASTVMCGQGADELCLGYHHFEGLSLEDTRARAREDWERLVSSEWPRARQFAQSQGRRLESPYLTEPFLGLVTAQPLERHRPSNERKPWLRALARRAGLPEELASRPKRAMQYGTGIDALLRRARPLASSDPGSGLAAQGPI
jgi:asparagine synthase (glutamine-hydrolysing)